MTENTNKKIFAFAGSFNPPHVGHMLAINEIINMGADRIHLFVRTNEALDIVDAKTKEKWFEQLKEEYSEVGWDKVIIHMAESKKVTGKRYSLKVVSDGIKLLDEQAGEHITHFYAGEDYSKLKYIWNLLVKDTKLVIGQRIEGVSSTNIRNNLEAYRFLLPDCIYEDIKAIQRSKMQQKEIN